MRASLLAFCTLLTLTVLYANSGNVPLARTGVPADGGQTCTSCHNSAFGANSGPGSAAIQAVSYTPGQKQTVSIRITDPAAQKWGFQLTARLLSAENTVAGAFTASPQVEVRCTLDPCFGSVQYASQRADASGASPSPRTFTVDWTPPLVDQGPVVFYAAALAGDGDGTAQGDRTYTARLVVAPSNSNLISFKLDTPGTPPNQGTEARAINNSGQSVGSFLENGKQRGFIRSASAAVTAFDAPGAESTDPRGINNLGEIVGFYNQKFGFLRKANGEISSIDYPGAADTFPYDINDAGDIVGAYRFANGSLLGFRRSAAGVFTSYQEPLTGVPGSPNQPPAINTELLSITNQGVILGRSAETRQQLGTVNIFARSFVIEPDGTKTYFNQVTSHGGPTSTAMNAARDVTGNLFSSMFLGNTTGGVTPFSIPGSLNTQAFGINDAGQVAGTYRSTDSAAYGFILNPCVAPVSPGNRTHGSGSEVGTISVTGDSGCLWLASSDVPWISIVSPVASGAGNGSIRYELQPNSGAARTGTLRVAGQSVAIQQAGSDCAYTVSPLQQNVGNSGGIVNFTIAVSASCPWTAAANSPLTPAAPEAGRGAGTVQATIPANTDTLSQAWTFRVAGQTAVVNQGAAPCTFTLSPGSTVVPAAGQSGDVVMTAGSNCQWTATSSASWLTITSGSSGTGNGSIRWTASGHLELTPRSATITAGGRTFTVNQLAVPSCQYILSTNFLQLPSGTGTATFNLSTGSTCPWTVSTNTPWIHIVAPAQTQGPVLIAFTYEANSGAQRWGGIEIGGQALQVTQQSAAAEAGLRFVPVAPCRLIDTRPEYGFTGAFGPPALSEDDTRQIPVLASRCGIPASAAAYSVNVTALPQTEFLGYLSLVPQGFAGPPVSTLNSWNGRVIANAAIVPAGIDGGIQVFVTDPAHLIIDINGYFVPKTDPARSLGFFPQAPCRLADSRVDRPEPYGLPQLGEEETREFPVRGNSICPVPAEAEAFSLNATAVPGEDFLGFLTLWPAGGGRPNVSTLNSWTGTVVANAAIVPAGTNGGVSAFASDATDLLLDINGTFAPATKPGGLNFYPVSPCRAFDTRGSGPGQITNGWRTFTLAGQCGIPQSAKAVALNATVVPSGTLAYLSLWPAGENQHGVSTLNSFDGQVVANMALVPTGANGAISAFAAGTTHLVLDVLGYFAP